MHPERHDLLLADEQRIGYGRLGDIELARSWGHTIRECGGKQRHERVEFPSQLVSGEAHLTTDNLAPSWQLQNHTNGMVSLGGYNAGEGLSELVNTQQPFTLTCTSPLTLLPSSFSLPTLHPSSGRGSLFSDETLLLDCPGPASGAPYSSALFWNDAGHRDPKAVCCPARLFAQ